MRVARYLCVAWRVVAGWAIDFLREQKGALRRVVTFSVGKVRLVISPAHTGVSGVLRLRAASLFFSVKASAVEGNWLKG